MSMRVESLWIYPVKACAGVRVQAAQVEARGFRGDRRWMIIDENNRHVTQREHGRLALLRPGLVQGGLRFEDGPELRPEETGPEIAVTVWDDEVQARPAPKAVNQWLSQEIGAALRLVYMPDSSHRPVDGAYGRAGDEVSFADGYPLLIFSTASLKLLNGRLPDSISPRRFRPNIVVTGAAAFAEDTWRLIRIGQVEIEVVKPCARCVVIDGDPDTGLQKKGVLKELASFRRIDGSVYFGQNGISRVHGSVWAGGTVQVLETGEPRPSLNGV